MSAAKKVLSDLRHSCPHRLAGPACRNLTRERVLDTRVWHYREQVIPAVQDTLRVLGFLDEEEK